MTTSSRRYVQHIADLSSDYRPQREWGEGRGILMVVGHFLVGIAGGAWVMGALYGSIAAQAVAVGLGVLGAFAHLAFLGKPARAFGMMRRVRTSCASHTASRASASAAPPVTASVSSRS